jgi:CheY-like chemotaxis protein
MPRTILLVEDNPITRKMVRFALEKHGFDVLEAPDGATALRAFPTGDIALVLQDLVLPDMDGFELVEKLRALPRGSEVPILAVSGLMSKVEEARMSAVGFDDVISKPVEPSRLLKIIRAHLPAAEAAPDRFGDDRRIVVADDEPVQRKLTAFRLSKVGFAVTEAADGAQALELARRVDPAAIVSDVLMPRLDGFGLCIAVRNDERLAQVPVVLMTNSYVEAPDRDLARRAGANDLVLRTPDLATVLRALRDSLAGNLAASSPAAEPDADLERERMRRVVKQLERQVNLNARVARRCAFLTAELSVLSGISEALAIQDDIDRALEQVLAACLDAGGISVGALYLTGVDHRRAISYGAASPWSEAELAAFFDATGMLDTAESQTVIPIPSAAVAGQHAGALLERGGVSSALIAPLQHRGKSLGALLTGSHEPGANTEDRVFFAQAVAGQISQALALAQAFAAKDDSERAARTQARVLRSILESMADGVVVADQAGELIHWNAAATALLGKGPTISRPETWTREYGLRHTDKVTPIEPGELPLLRALRGESLDDVELYMTRDGLSEGAWLSASARPLRDEDGESQGGVAVFRDVTREKAARAQLMVSDRMASIGMLAAGVAHEINNPLTAVVANLDVAVRDLAELARGPAGAGLSSLIEGMTDARDAAERVRHIVRDLKTFSRAEDDQSGAVDVTRVLESSVRMAWNEIRHRARVVKDYREVPPVRANESRLGQVFLNLVVNAAQAIPEGHADRNEIRLSIRAGDAGRVVVEVADTGAGMSPLVLSRLFTPFFTTKPPGVGTGLGLAICHRLISEIGGEITVDSEVGSGTVFRVILPVMTGEDRRAARPEAPAVDAPSRRGRILVIDDEKMIGSVIGRLLGADHDVVSTTSALEALDCIVDAEPFDVIMCDLMMPVMTGMDFFERLSEVAPDQLDSVVFLTGGAFTPAARAFLDRVSNARLEKPFDLKSLRALVNESVH